jgi:hypothetical protein
MFRLNKVPEPDNGVKSVEKADIRSVLIVPVPITFAETFQLVEVSPAAETGVAWKVITDESKVKSPWNPTRLREGSIAVLSTVWVKLVTAVLIVAKGNEIVTGMWGVGVGVGVGVTGMVAVGVGLGGVNVGVGVGVPAPQLGNLKLPIRVRQLPPLI